MARICIHTFGCQMNKLDSEIVEEILRSAGHTLVSEEEEAEVILFNTCSVREHAEERVLSRLFQLRSRKEREPHLRLGVLGCMAQRLGARLWDRVPFVDLICGTHAFPRIATLLAEAEKGPVLAIEEDDSLRREMDFYEERRRISSALAYIAVMRGCNNRCAYCVVPSVRGRETSRPIEAILEEGRKLVNQGVREITLVGQNINAYGKDIGIDLAALLRALHELEGLLRIRFLTSHPRDISDDFLRTLAELPRVAKHLHMPAQSGSTKILRAMRRGYDREHYDDRLAAIQRWVPSALVTSDFIVGFPGETEADFLETLELVKKARFQNSYIFKYSPRPGTPAAELPDDVPLEEKKRRHRILLAAQNEVNRERTQRLIGSIQTILVEGISPRDPHRMIGRTETNLICVFPPPPEPSKLVGTLLPLRIVEATPLTLIGVGAKEGDKEEKVGGRY